MKPGVRYNFSKQEIVSILKSTKTVAELAKQYKTGRRAMLNIVKGRTYAHVRPDIQRRPYGYTGDKRKNHKRKLNEKEIVYILTSYESSNKLAKEFGMCRDVIQRIRNNKLYKDVRPDIPRTCNQSCNSCMHFKNDKCLLEIPEFKEYYTRAAKQCNVYSSAKPIIRRSVPMPQVYVKGEQHGSAVLTERDVLKIRENYANGMKTKEIMNYTGMSKNCIRSIIKRTTWKHI